MNSINSSYYKDKEVCYICNMLFPSSSLNVHIQDCKKEFAKSQSSKPYNQRERLPTRSKSPKPQQRSKADSIRNKSPQKVNESFEFLPCDYCGSNFSIGAMGSHLRECESRLAER